MSDLKINPVTGEVLPKPLSTLAFYFAPGVNVQGAVLTGAVLGTSNETAVISPYGMIFDPAFSGGGITDWGFFSASVPNGDISIINPDQTARFSIRDWKFVADHSPSITIQRTGDTIMGRYQGYKASAGFNTGFRNYGATLVNASFNEGTNSFDADDESHSQWYHHACEYEWRDPNSNFIQTEANWGTFTRRIFNSYVKVGVPIKAVPLGANPSVETARVHGLFSPSVATISHASPAVVTLASHGFSINDTVAFSNSGGALPSPLAANTIYYVLTVPTSGTFTVSATQGGSAINTTTDGSGTHSVVKAPPADINDCPALLSGSVSINGSHFIIPTDTTHFTIPNVTVATQVVSGTDLDTTGWVRTDNIAGADTHGVVLAGGFFSAIALATDKGNNLSDPAFLFSQLNGAAALTELIVQNAPASGETATSIAAGASLTLRGVGSAPGGSGYTSGWTLATDDSGGGVPAGKNTLSLTNRITGGYAPFFINESNLIGMGKPGLGRNWSASPPVSAVEVDGTLTATAFSGTSASLSSAVVPLISGSTAANGDITINGTTSGTKTSSYVILQDTGGNVGIGTISPSTTLTVSGTFLATGNGEVQGTLTVGGQAVLQSNSTVGGSTIALIAATNTFTFANTFTSAAPQLTLGVNTTTLGAIKMFGNTSGNVTLQPTAVAGTNIVLTLPAATGTILTNVSTLASTNTIDLGTVTLTGNLPNARNTVSNSTTTTLTALTNASSGANMTVGPDSGTSNSLTFQVRTSAPATISPWSISTAGNLIPGTDNTYNIGTSSSAGRVASLFAIKVAVNNSGLFRNGGTNLTQLVDVGENVFASLQLLNLTATGNIIATPEALAPALNAGATVSVAISSSSIAVNGANALTLANGTNGQIKTLVCTAVTSAGTATLTPTTANGYTTVAFTAAGQTLTLQYFSTGGWVILSVRGATPA